MDQSLISNYNLQQCIEIKKNSRHKYIKTSFLPVSVVYGDEWFPKVLTKHSARCRSLRAIA